MWKFFYPILKPYKWHYFVMFQIPMIQVAFTVLNSYALKLIIDTGTNSEIATKWSIIYPILILIGISLLQEIVCKGGHWAFNKSQPFIRGEIVSKTYQYIQNHSYSFFQNTHSGAISSKIKGIVAGYDNVFEYIWYKITNPLTMSIFGTLSLCFINLNLAILVSIWCIIFVIVGGKMSLKLGLLSQQTNNMKHNAIGKISDNISNIFTIFAFATKQYEFNKIRNFVCKNVADLDYKQCFYHFKFACITAGLFMGTSSSVLIYAGYLRYINVITIGDFAYIITILYRIMYDIWTLSEQIGNFFDKFGDFKSSFSILKIPNEIIYSPLATPLTIQNPTVEFKNVCFRYNEKLIEEKFTEENLNNKTNVFNNFNLFIKAGENIGIIGESGAGKSSMINLLLKYFQTNSGEILIDNQNINNLTADSIRQNIAVIPQDIMLFHTNLMENIRYGNLNATNEEVIDASKKAHIHDFIQQLPEKYDTEVGERGVKLSGGQRQRIAIARAILKHAPILILDEATSSLDSETEELIQKSINYLLESRNFTVIAIAHRTSTLKHMDRIIKLDKGKIIKECGFEGL